MKKSALLLALILVFLVIPFNSLALQTHVLYLDSQVAGTNPDPSRGYKYYVKYVNAQGNIVEDYPVFTASNTRKAYYVADRTAFYAQFLPEDLTGYKIGLQLGSDSIQWNTDRANLDSVWYDSGAVCFYVRYDTSVKTIPLTKMVSGTADPNTVYHFEVLSHDYNYRYIKKEYDLKAGETVNIPYVFVNGYENAIYISEVGAPSGSKASFTLNGSSLSSGTVPGGHGDYTGTEWQAKIPDVNQLLGQSTVICTNTYQAKPVSVQFSGKKTLNGRTLSAGEFSFTLSGNGTSETVKNGADGKITFSKLTFNKAGTYTYTVKEEATDEVGVTIDSKVYNITVTVTDDGNGQLKATISGINADGSGLDFTNNYSERTFTPEVQKAVSGTGAPADEVFTFTLTDGTYTDSASCKAGGTAAFDTITYHEAGTYTYTITENVPAVKTPGMTYSEETVTCTVVVARDDSTGELSVTSKAYSVDGIIGNTITNTYEMPEGSAQLKANKTVTGNTYTSTDKNFTVTLGIDTNTLTSTTNNVLDSATSKVQTVANGGTAAWIVNYDKPGTYTYTITESDGSEKGVEYDTTAYTAKVVVAYAADGMSLVSTVTYGDGSTTVPTITNKYSETTFTPEVQKTVSGTGAPEDEVFTFSLTDGTYTDSASCKAGGTAAFDTITYHEAGTYTYTITENVPAVKTPGMTYSEETVNCTVVVARDASTGELSVTSKAYSVDGIIGNTITNTYEMPEGTAELKANKTVTGNTYTSTDKNFTVTLGIDTNTLNSTTNNVLDSATSKVQTVANGGTAAWIVNYDKPGTYTYTITESDGGEEGMEYDTTAYTAKVEVVYAADGMTLVPTVTYGNGSTTVPMITNKYGETAFTPEVQKAVSGTGAPEDEVFTFSLTDGIYTDSASCKAGGTAAFDTITYHEAGTYTYTITENVPAVKTPGMTYSTETVTCTVVVARNDSTGELSVTSTAYTVDGSTGNTITNTYEMPEGTAELKANKTVTGNTYTSTDKNFTVTLGIDTNTLTSTTNNVLDSATSKVQTVANGGTAAWTVNYDKPGTYTYTITESDGSETGMEYDTTAYTAQVVVAYSADGMSLVPTVTYGNGSTTVPTITNKYSEITFTPEVRKSVTGIGAPADEIFTFSLTDGTYTDSARCKAAETAAFEEITYHEPGTYTYTITEDVPAEKTHGMTYSEETVTCTVVVARDTSTGELSIASTTYTVGGKTGNIITNTYVKPETSAELNAKKTVTGSVYTSTDENFTVTLGIDENTLTSATNNILDGTTAAEQTVANGGTLSWKVNYDQPGTYTYTITETEGSEAGVKYDTTAYTATVVVEYTADGMGLDATVTYDGSSTEMPVITNKYSEIRFTPEIMKQVKGVRSTDVFTFRLTDGIITADGSTDGIYTDEASCKANEIATFKPIILHEEGTYTYYVNEVVPDKPTPGMTYSDKTVVITVTVTHEADDTLSLEATYTDNGIIYNIYTPGNDPGYDYKFSFTKLWKGAVGESIEWTFYNPDGTVAHKAFNKRIVSEDEWVYEGWFGTSKDYYLIETVPEGYRVIYENVGAHAGETDRCYNGGTIINYKVPQTGDDSNMPLWFSMLGISILGLAGVMCANKKKRGNVSMRNR